MTTTFTGESLTSPNPADIDRLSVDEQTLIEGWLVPGWLEEDTAVSAGLSKKVLEAVRARHTDPNDPFELSVEATRRYAWLDGESYSANTVRLTAIGSVPLVGALTGEPVGDDLEQELLTWSMLSQRVSQYVDGTLQNLTEDEWIDLEHGDIRAEIVQLCLMLHSTELDPQAKTRLKLVAETVEVRLPKKSVESVAFIKGGHSKRSKASY